MTSPVWRAKATDAMAAAVTAFFARSDGPPPAITATAVKGADAK